LHDWLQGYVNPGSSGGHDLRARFPLAAARISVREQPGRPGVYGCTVHLQPHLQLDDVTATFRLVTEIAGPHRT
jgi:type VI secretion system protein ImpD/type VI secretion system protein ImpC